MDPLETRLSEPRLGPLAVWLAATALAVTLWVLMRHGLAVPASTDDFCNRLNALQGTVLEATMASYTGWTGRLVTTAALYLTLRTVDLPHLSNVSAMLPALLAMACWFLSGAFGSRHLVDRLAIAAFAFVVLVIGLHRLLGQTVFWVTGGIVYLVPLVLVSAWLSMMARIAEGKRPLGGVAGALLLGLVAGNAIELAWAVLIVTGMAVLVHVRGAAAGASLRGGSAGRCARGRARARGGTGQFPSRHRHRALVQPRPRLPGRRVRAHAARGPGRRAGTRRRHAGARRAGFRRATGRPRPERRAARTHRAAARAGRARQPRARAGGAAPVRATQRTVPAGAAFRAPAWSWRSRRSSPRATAPSPSPRSRSAGALATSFRFVHETDAARVLQQNWVQRDALLRSAAVAGRLEVVLPRRPAWPPPTVHAIELGEDPARWDNKCVARYYGLSRVSAPPPK